MLNNENNKRIVKNTLILYVRMLFTMVLTLYISRIILNSLGVEDFGIYNVVGGVVAMFSFLNSAMAVSTQRFLSFELGCQNWSQLKKVFSIAVIIHLLLGILIVILAETVGVWFLNNKMNIPAERIYAANVVFQCSVFSFFFLIVRIPYHAGIIAFEKMGGYAYISILEVTLKLGIALLLICFGSDKLILYAVLSLCIVIIITCIYRIYCNRHFSELRFNFVWDKHLFKTMTSYAGWSLFGSGATVVYEQGINILLNIFFNPIVNAARAIAFQVNTAILSFTSNFQIAVNPQIVKSYATGDRQYMMSLIFQSSRYSFFLLYLIALPVLLETDVLLKLWLKIVPEYTSIFCKLIIIDALIGCVSYPLMVASQATGKIRLYQFVVGSILLLNLPCTYTLLKLGFSPEYSMYVSIFLSIIALGARLIMLRSLIELDIKQYIKDVVIKSLVVGGVAFVIPFLSISYIHSSAILPFLLNSALCIVCSVLSIYYLGFDAVEKAYIKGRVLFVLGKFGVYK